MQDFDTTNEQERSFVDSIGELQKVNRKLAKLLVRKEELTDLIIGSLDHEHEGQKTYEYGEWKIEVKTPFIYSLNKRLYEDCELNIPDEYNPIKRSFAYSIDKRLCDEYLVTAPEDVRDTLISLIEKKPGKASIVLKERI